MAVKPDAQFFVTAKIASMIFFIAELLSAMTKSFDRNVQSRPAKHRWRHRQPVSPKFLGNQSEDSHPMPVNDNDMFVVRREHVVHCTAGAYRNRSEITLGG